MDIGKFVDSVRFPDYVKARAHPVSPGLPKRATGRNETVSGRYILVEMKIQYLNKLNVVKVQRKRSEKNSLSPEQFSLTKATKL